jgi:adenylate kinase
VRVVIVGRPAGGKSTLTDLLVDRCPGLRTFGVRRHFAQQVESGTAVGLAVREIVARGGWIPDDLVVGAVRDLIASGSLGPDFILEGMPGNREQAALLDLLLEELGLPLDCVLHVETPESVCLARAAERLVCYRCDGGSHQAVRSAAGSCARCGGPVTPRSADAVGPLTDRLSLYRTQSPEILDYYGAERVLVLDGCRRPTEIADEVLDHLAELGSAVRS